MAESRKEAGRYGVPPIEQVFEKKLIAMLEQFELGLMPRTTCEIDLKFLNGFD